MKFIIYFSFFNLFPLFIEKENRELFHEMLENAFSLSPQLEKNVLNLL